MENDIQELPNVDLTPVLDQIKETQEEGSQESQVEKPRNKYGQFTKKDGTLDEDGVLKSYKEIQSAFTRVSQDNKASKEEMERLREQVELSKYQTQIPMYQEPPPQIDDNNPIRTFNVMRIAEILEEESDKNKLEFQERYAYAKMASQEYPQLSTTAKGVKKLFELGDKLRAEHLKKGASKALESIFGEPLGEEEITRLKTLVKGDKSHTKDPVKNNSNAYMPDTTSTTRSNTDQNRNPNLDLEIAESVKQGDVDGVIKTLFRKALAE